MLIKLKDNDGRVIKEVEVDDAFGEWYIKQERIEENAKRRSRYWVIVSLDSLDYEGTLYEDKSTNPKESFIQKIEKKNVNKFLKTLTDVQRRRLILRMENPNITTREIARRENVDEKAIRKSFDEIRKKFLMFYDK